MAEVLNTVSSSDDILRRGTIDPGVQVDNSFSHYKISHTLHVGSVTCTLEFFWKAALLAHFPNLAQEMANLIQCD